MKIGIITYDKPHRKTQEVLFGLNQLGYKKIKLIITKFKKFKNKKKNNFFEHRPHQFEGPNINEISKYYGLSLSDMNDKKVFSNLDVTLICGSALINQKLIKKNFIINCHSGLIPLRRGLDSFKWAVLNNEPIGNTLHFIDSKVDFGKIITHKLTPIFQSDTTHFFSKRHYSEEIRMLINFEYHLNNPNILELKTKNPKMRMPLDQEKIMLKNFKQYKEIFCK